MMSLRALGSPDDGVLVQGFLKRYVRLHVVKVLQKISDVTIQC